MGQLLVGLARVGGRLVARLASVAFELAIWSSPVWLTVVVSCWQNERAQRVAITEVYGTAAYEAGLRVNRRGELTDGREADPTARSIVMFRPIIPTIAAFFGAVLLSDNLLRRYYGGGYSGQEPLVSWPRRPAPDHPERATATDPARGS